MIRPVPFGRLKVFTATVPNRLWLTDITEHRTNEGKLYLCAIKDVYSNGIVGYSIDARMRAALAVSARRNAAALRSPEGTVVHSDSETVLTGIETAPGFVDSLI